MMGRAHIAGVQKKRVAYATRSISVSNTSGSGVNENRNVIFAFDPNGNNVFGAIAFGFKSGRDFAIGTDIGLKRRNLGFKSRTDIGKSRCIKFFGGFEIGNYHDFDIGICANRFKIGIGRALQRCHQVRISVLTGIGSGVNRRIDANPSVFASFDTNAGIDVDIKVLSRNGQRSRKRKGCAKGKSRELIHWIFSIVEGVLPSPVASKTTTGPEGFKVILWQGAMIAPSLMRVREQAFCQQRQFQVQ